LGEFGRVWVCSGVFGCAWALSDSPPIQNSKISLENAKKYVLELRRMSLEQNSGLLIALVGTKSDLNLSTQSLPFLSPSFDDPSPLASHASLPSSAPSSSPLSSREENVARLAQSFASKHEVFLFSFPTLSFFRFSFFVFLSLLSFIYSLPSGHLDRNLREKRNGNQRAFQYRSDNCGSHRRRSRKTNSSLPACIRVPLRFFLYCFCFCSSSFPYLLM
jgi:hypothetical protein